MKVAVYGAGFRVRVFFFIGPRQAAGGTPGSGMYFMNDPTLHLVWFEDGRLALCCTFSGLTARPCLVEYLEQFDFGLLHLLRRNQVGLCVGPGLQCRQGQAGFELGTIGTVLGHKGGVSTLRYSHLRTSKLALALANVGRKKAPAQVKKLARRKPNKSA